MRTRSQARRRRQPQVRQTSVESPNLEKPTNNQETFNPPIVTMDDNRTMAQLLEAPTEGYEDAIVVPEINANNFEIKHGLLNLVQNKQFFGHDKEDPHAHIRYFNKITSTMKFPNVPSTSVKLMLFPFSLEGAARIWLDKEPPRSILTWDDLVSKFINKFFPPSKTTNLRNEITRFQQRFDESFYEAWDRFNDLLRACPHHGFSELHQLDTFYNALNSNDQDSLNSAAGGNFLDKMPRECLKIIESKSKVRNSRSKPVVAKVSTSTSTSGISPDVSELKDMVKALLLDKKNQSQAPAHQTPASVKAVEESCVTCGGAHSYQSCPATDGNVYHDNIQAYVSQAAAANFNQGNTSARPPMVANQIRPPGKTIASPYPSVGARSSSSIVRSAIGATSTIVRSSGTQTANLQNLDTHENNDWRISVRDRLGSRDVHSRLGQRRSPSESPPSSDSEDSRRKRRRRVSSSSEDSSDNEDAETGHWKSKNTYREDETKVIPDDHLKHLPNRPLLKTGHNLCGATFIKIHEEVCQEPCRACQGETTPRGVYKHLQLIKRLNDRVPQTFDELMKRTRSFIQGEATAADSRRGYSNNRSQEQSRRQSNGQSGSRNNSYHEVANLPKVPPPMRTPEEQREVPDTITNAIQWHYWKTRISAIRAVPSTAHGMLKFPVDGGIVTIYNTAAPPKECNTVTCDVPQTKRQHATKVTNLKVAIHPDYPEQEVSIGGSLSDTGRALTQVENPTRILPSKDTPERAKAILEEAEYCLDFTDLNKASGIDEKFLSKSADKSLPLFKTLKKCTKKGDFRWTTEAEEAFTLLKQHIAALPTLVAPRPGGVDNIFIRDAWGN
ncbi:reverse transcriptase domain-containing protein [Tanacetum coccineum]